MMGFFSKKRTKAAAREDHTEQKNGNAIENKPEQEQALDYMDVRKIEDSSKRIPLMIKCAENGDLLALYEVGEMYLQGNGVERDVEKGIALLRKAAKKGASGAITAVAVFYMNEAFNELKKEKIQQFGQDACIKNFNEKYEKGAAYLAWALSKGNNAAIEIYTGAASFGWNEGQYSEMLKMSTQVAFEPYKDKLLEDATDTDFYVLGLLSLRGIAVPQDIAAAREYFEKSASLGNKQAKKELDNPLLSLPEDEDDE